MDGIVESSAGRAIRGVERRQLPVMDVAPVLAGDREGTRKLAVAWRQVSETVGFLAIVNHGIPKDLVDRMTAQAKAFHDLPHEVKNTIPLSTDQKGFQTSRVSTVTHSVYSKNRKLDNNEALVLATDYPADHPQVKAGKRFYGHNRWLPEDVLPGFRATATEYMDTMTALGKKLLPLWAMALELPETFFEPYFKDNYTYFRVSRYPAKADIEVDEFAISSHADTGFMTFVPPATEEGIQIMSPDGKWFWPDFPADGIILNTGMFLERWSNKRFRATPHRVIPPVKNDRYSLPLFVNPSFDAVGECLPTCTSADNPPRFPTQTYWEFFNWYMENTFTHYGKLKKTAGDAVEVPAESAAG